MFRSYITLFTLRLLQIFYLFYRITFKTDGYKDPCHVDWVKKTVGAGLFKTEETVPVPNYDCNSQKGFSLTVKPVSSCPSYDSHFNRGEKACQKKNP